MAIERKFILDSGAYSIHNSGKEVSIDRYIDFCLEHPDISYYVSLDHIPSNQGVRSKEILSEACEKSWENYLRIIEELPKEKVIPVFHKGEDFRFLRRYIDFGCDYIGIGQLHFNHSSRKGGYRSVREQQKDWLRLLGRQTDQPVRYHGLAVTSFALMTAFPWYSVDSSSWLKLASLGEVQVPFFRRGKPDFTHRGILVNISPRSPDKRKKGHHIDNLSPTIRSNVRDYLGSFGIPWGKYEVKKVPRAYELKENELWWGPKGGGDVAIIQEVGLTTCYQRRLLVNAHFMHQQNLALDIEHIYLAAGDGVIQPEIEMKLYKRLMSFYYMTISRKARKEVAAHCERIADAKNETSD